MKVLEYTAIGALLTLAALVAFWNLQEGVNNPGAHPRTTKFFTIHPMIFQILVHVMFLGLLVGNTIDSLPRVTFENQRTFLTLPLYLALICPAVMCVAHFRFRDFSLNLGMSKHQVASENSIVYATLKVSGWLLSVAMLVVGLYIKMYHNYSFIGIIWTVGVAGMMFIPIRKPIFMIRNRKSKFDKHWEIAS